MSFDWHMLYPLHTVILDNSHVFGGVLCKAQLCNFSKWFFSPRFGVVPIWELWQFCYVRIGPPKPTSTFHRSLVLPGMASSVSRSKGRKCAPLSAPSLCHGFGFYQGTHVWRAPTGAFHQSLVLPGMGAEARDPRVQSVLDYPPPHCGPLLWFVSRDPCMESPNRCLSPEPCLARNGCTSFEIQGSKMCSTIHPLTPSHCFGFFQTSHVWKAPTSGFYHSLVLPGMVASISTYKCGKCARLSAPSLWATALVSFKGLIYGKPQPVPFTTALFCQDWLHQFRDPRVESVLDHPPPHCGPLFWFVSRDPCIESPNQCLSPEPCFARNGCMGFGIQGSKVCSTIQPLTLGNCFGFSQGTHVWKAPTSAFHQSLVLSGMVASVSRYKGRKCARLSAPSMWANVLVCVKGPMYGKPQPLAFTTSLFCQEWLHQFRDPSVESVLDYPPPHSGSLFWFLSRDPSMKAPGMVASVSRSKGRKCARLSAPSLWATVMVCIKGPMYGRPQPVPFTRALFCQEWLH